MNIGDLVEDTQTENNPALTAHHVGESGLIKGLYLSVKTRMKQK